MKKVCTSCGLEKDEEEFSWRWKALGRRQSICKSCQRQRSADWYQEHREEHIERTRAGKAGAIETAQRFIYDYLSRSVCADCGEYHYEYLTFDHVRGKKKMEISQMVAQGYSIEAIKEELVKCEVVCFNHHMEREAKRRSGGRFRKFWPRFPGEE
jgi:hypothetical protein